MLSPSERDLLDRVESYAGRMATLATDLIAVPTENPPGVAYPECVELLVDALAGLGLNPRVIDVPGPDDDPYARSCLLAGHDAGRPAIHFHGHYDVVPADSVEQFTPNTVDNRLYGRGSADMKGGLAAMIFAAKALNDLGLTRSGQVALTLVPDEETGGQRGSRYLADQGLLGRDAIGMLTPEPTGGIVWNACRGAITLRVTIHGRYAHVGQHYLGVNAFERALTVASGLNALKQEIEERQTAYRLDSEPDPEAARHSILMLGGKVEGGTSFNAVPSTCSFTVERRFNPEEDLAVEKQRILSVLDQAKADGIDLDVEVLQEATAARFVEDTRFERALSGSIEEITGRPPRFEMCPGLLEIRWYAQLGIPAVAYGPGLLSVSHGPGEFVDLDLLVECAKIYALTALRALDS